jgi:lambda family phage portal protein
VSLVGRILERFRGRPEAKPDAPPTRVVIRSRYDAAGDQKEQREHWSLADALSANALNDSGTRAKLRSRARYECRNNGYARGLVAGIAQDVIGTGPRLQLNLGESGRERARKVEAAWRAWCEAADLADKLRVKHESKVRDGECFALLTRNESIAHPVKLDVQLVECDRVETPWGVDLGGSVQDGIQFDRLGNPVAYYVSRTHPGDLAATTEYDRVAAANVLHWFRADRPGQVRGVSELAASLNLFGQLRRFTLATLTAAETSATIAGVLETDMPPPDDGSAVPVDVATEIPLAPGSLLTLSHGWKAQGFKAEQPVSTYGEFKGEILAEAGRGPGAPRSLTTADSSAFNFSSARLDHLPYQRGVWIERRRDRRQLDKLFAAWWAEYTLIPEAAGGAPAGLPDFATITWDWHWDGFSWMDPAKDAQAVQSRLDMNLTTLAEECAAEGKDWEESLEQRARELARIKELEVRYGVKFGPADAAAPAPADPSGAAEDTVLEDDPSEVPA